MGTHAYVRAHSSGSSTLISFFAYLLDHSAVVVVVAAFPSPATDRSQVAEGLAQYGGQSVRGPYYAKLSQRLQAQVRRESVAIRGLLWASPMYQLRLQDS
jgi:hypothetical protein